MYEIEIADEQTEFEVDHEQLLSVARAVLADERVERAEISLALVDSATMQELNRTHLNHDYDTDVLSFLLECTAGTADENENRRGAGKSLEGQLVISVPMAARTASRYAWQMQDEVVLYLVHGLLHLVGYDDLTEEELQIMRERERSLLHECGLEVRYDEQPGTSSAPVERRS